MANTPLQPFDLRPLKKHRRSSIANTSLKLIHQAIYDSGKSLRVVLLRGPRGAEERHEPEGGYGKTRLLEEVVKPPGQMAHGKRPMRPPCRSLSI